MRLRGVELGNILGASGVQGFFGEGYWFHPFLKPLGLNFEGLTFVAKTTTLEPRSGNLALDEKFRPKDLFPKCIAIKPLKGAMLNAIGLSGPGARALLETGLWQKRTKPFFISFMSVAATTEERLIELKKFVSLLKNHLQNFKAPIGLQINYSCPNAGLNLDAVLDEVSSGLNAAAKLKIPLMPKFNILIPPELAKKISEHKECDGICISNTIPYGKLPEKIDWKKIFGSEKSPLDHLGGGGLSGKPISRPVQNWIMRARIAGLEKHINGGGGIMSPHDVDDFFEVGASSVFLGTAALFRFWRVKKIIKRANNKHTSKS